MIIFGRFSLWLFAALLALTLTAAVAVQHPVLAAAAVAIVAILAVAWRRSGSAR